MSKFKEFLVYAGLAIVSLTFLAIMDGRDKAHCREIGGQWVEAQTINRSMCIEKVP